MSMNYFLNSRPGLFQADVCVSLQEIFWIYILSFVSSFWFLVKFKIRIKNESY